jgi:predicted dehydrogenase
MSRGPTGNSHRLAVIGAHRRGRALSGLVHLPEDGFHLVAACAATLENLGDYRERYGPRFEVTTCYPDLLSRDDIDTVMICTPDHLHVEHAEAALDAGKNVFLEKPMAITLDGADRILMAARRSRGKLYVGHNMRFFPVMRKMHELIAEGRIGRVEAVWCRHFVGIGGDAYFKDWHSERKNVTGLLLQKGAHDLDIIHWLAGGTTARVVGLGKLSVYNEAPGRRHPGAAGSAPGAKLIDDANWPPLAQQGLSPVIDVEDHSMLLLQLDNGVQASYTQCHYTPDYVRNYTVIGTEGRLENHGDFSDEEFTACVHLRYRRGAYRNEGHEVFPVEPVSGSHGGADTLMIEDFLDFLRGRPSGGADPLAARMAVAAGYLGTLSLREGSRPFDVPPPPRG